MRAYTLRRSMSSKDGADGVDYELCGLQALDDREAVEIARTRVDSDDSRLLTVELFDANERTIWGLQRGATISTRPDEAENSPMHKLAPTSLYRLRTLAETGARFYQVSVYMRRLETLGLVAGTGRSDPAADSVEYEITDAGRAELEERYGGTSPAHEGN